MVAEDGDNIVEIAADLRRRSGQGEPAFSTRRIIETCFPNTLVTGGRLPAGVDEAVKQTSDGPVIMYARALPGPAQRFAIAHALAHLIFDGGRAGFRGGRVGNPPHEVRADAFAGELLAPLADLAKHMNHEPSPDPHAHEVYLDEVDEIASVFALPAQIIDVRIRLVLSRSRNEQRKRLTNR